MRWGLSIPTTTSSEPISVVMVRVDSLMLRTNAGGIIAFAMEAYEKGLLSRKDTDGIELVWGSGDAMVKMVEKMGRGEGIGKLMAEGSRKMAEALGKNAIEFAIHVKGLEPSAHDPRRFFSQALSYATAARGACHLRGTFYKAELAGEVDPAKVEGKASKQIDYEDRACLFDSLILCRFFRDFFLWDEIGALIRGATGLDWDRTALERFANGVTLASREYNRREGLGPESDRLPAALLKANEQGASISAAELAYMIDDYNAIRAARAQS